MATTPQTTAAGATTVIDFSQDMYGLPLIRAPFGTVPVIYADHTASGQPYRIIDDYLRCTVEPYYANTHSNAYSGQRMAHLIEQARQCIRTSVHADCATDAVLFTGSGSSAAVTHFIHILNLFTTQPPMPLTDKQQCPWVIISDIEHNSNFLPWTNGGSVDLHIARTDATGTIDLIELERHIQQTMHLHNGVRIASLSAGSNITGVIQPVTALTRLLKRYDFIVAFDYAAVAPYVPINMHPVGSPSIDAIYVSPHKFLGGPGAPGLLVVARRLIRNKRPFYPSGGTVQYANRDMQVWTADGETRESGGTPQIIGSIRCGLVFALKDRYQHYITARETTIVERMRTHLQQMRGVRALLTTSAHQIPVFPLLFERLHYNLAVVLLSDLFGVQTRGGISCSSIGADRLFKIDASQRQQIMQSVTTGTGTPVNYGWCRVTLHFTMSDVTIAYILQAIRTVAKYGHLFTKFYTYNADRNNWTAAVAYEHEPVAQLDLSGSVTVPKCYRQLDAIQIARIQKRVRTLVRSLQNKH